MGPPQYELQAVVLHHGKKATGGHYSAFTLDTQPAVVPATAGGANAAKSVPPAIVSIPGLPPPSVTTATSKNKNSKPNKTLATAAVSSGPKPCEGNACVVSC